MRNEPGSSRDGQPIRVDAPDHAVIPGDVEMQGEEFEVGANDENPNFQRVPDQDQPSEENPHVESQSPQSSEPRNSLRETCARDSRRRVFLLFLPAKMLWHSVRIAWNLLVYRTNNGKRLVSK